MKRLTILFATALVAVMLMAPAAFAQNTMMGGQTGMMGATTSGMGASDLPESGGPAILLPAAALLLGSGILTYAVLRRR